MTEEVVFGLDVSTLDADRLMNRFIRKDWTVIEVALSSGKWFDYRFMNPVAATYQFAHEFKRVYKRAYKSNIDTARGEFVKPLPDDLFTLPDVTKMSEKKGLKAIKARKDVISGIWRARQVADAMGMPYDIYLDRAYHWTLRYWKQRDLPRPKQLYTDLVTDRAAIDWLEYQSTRLYYSKLPEFKSACYDSRVKAQNDHHTWLFEQAAARGNAPRILAHMIDEDILPIFKIQERLGSEICQSALALTERNPQQIQYN